MTSPKTSRPAPSRRSGPNPILVVGGVVLAVIVVAVIAVLVAGGNDSGDAGGGSETTFQPAPVDPDLLDPRIPAELIGEVRPIEIEGEPLPVFAAQPVDPAIGMVPPAIYGEDATGFVHSISPDIDGAVMLVFLAHWCPACNQELPMLAQLGQQGLMPEDVKVYAVLTGMDPARPNWPPSQWLARAGWPFESVADEPDMDRGGEWKAASSFGLTSYPYVVLIDDGVVVDRWSGVSTPEQLVARVEAAIS